MSYEVVSPRAVYRWVPEHTAAVQKLGLTDGDGMWRDGVSLWIHDFYWELIGIGATPRQLKRCMRAVRKVKRRGELPLKIKELIQVLRIVDGLARDG